MRFGHSDRLRAEFPDLACGVLHVTGISAEASVDRAVEPCVEAARRRLSRDGSEGDFPEIQAWRRAFSKLGLKPTQYRCAAEALLRRLRREGSLPRLHPLVDLCNAVSAATAVPIGIFDLDRIDGDLMVRHAAGDETYTAFSGEDETPAPDEVVFADDAGRAHSRRWCNRQSGYSAVGPGTRSALIVCEALHATAAADMEAIVDRLAERVAVIWSPPRDRALLTGSAPDITLRLD